MYDADEGIVTPIDHERPRAGSNVFDHPSLPHDKYESLSLKLDFDDDFDDGGLISPIHRRPREASHIRDLPSVPSEKMSGDSQQDKEMFDVPSSQQHSEKNQFDLPPQYTSSSSSNKNRVRDLYSNPTSLLPPASTATQPQQSAATKIAEKYDALSQRVEERVKIEMESTLERERESMQLVDMLQHARDVASKENKSLEPSIVIKISNSFFRSLLNEAQEKLKNINSSIQKYNDGVASCRETGTVRNDV